MAPKLSIDISLTQTQNIRIQNPFFGIAPLKTTVDQIDS